MGTGALSPGLKRLGREDDHLPACSAKVKNAWWSYTSTSLYVFMTGNSLFIIIIIIGQP
jgi:hypothetical protein